VFRKEEEINFFVNFETLLENTRSALQAKAQTLYEAKFEEALDAVFADDSSSVLNIADFSAITVGGQLKEEQIYPVDFSLFNEVWFDVPDFYTVSPKISNETGISLLAALNVDILHRKKAKFEFRLFDSVAKAELDRISIESHDFKVFDRVGAVVKDKIETVPIQLSYIGPVPEYTCNDSVVPVCSSEDSLNVRSHVSTNVENTYSEDAVTEEFKVITDRLKENNVQSKVQSDLEIINYNVPRIFRVQWRMVVDETDATLAHKRDLTNIRFNSAVPRADDFDISLNVYSFGDVRKKKVLKAGVETFKNQTKKRINASFLTTSYSDAYSVVLSCNKNINVWYEEKTNDGFTIVSEKPLTGEVSWIVNKQAEIIEKVDTELSLEIPKCMVDFKPLFAEQSNFDILIKEGYNITTIAQTDFLTASSTVEDISGATLPDPASTQPEYIDPKGPNCSTECENDCPDGWFCNSDCYGSVFTQSGCACCECIEDGNCPDGYFCGELGECIPYF